MCLPYAVSDVDISNSHYWMVNEINVNLSNGDKDIHGQYESQNRAFFLYNSIYSVRTTQLCLFHHYVAQIFYASLCKSAHIWLNHRIPSQQFFSYIFVTTYDKLEESVNQSNRTLISTFLSQIGKYNPTCESFKPKLSASFLRSGLLMYFWSWNRSSNFCRWISEKTARRESPRRALAGALLKKSKQENGWSKLKFLRKSHWLVTATADSKDRWFDESSVFGLFLIRSSFGAFRRPLQY